jgi:hypothetical protein
LFSWPLWRPFGNLRPGRPAPLWKRHWLTVKESDLTGLQSTNKNKEQE